MTPSDRFAERFMRRLTGRPAMPFATFMELALYDPAVGYYRSERRRVGRNPESDFYTAETYSEVFSELVAASGVSRLNGRDPQDFSFVEIGAEPTGGLAGEALNKFGARESIGVADTLRLTGKAVCFSNELFDAQPFHRVVRRGGRWIEQGVALNGSDYVWTNLDRLSPVAGRICADIRDPMPEGYTIDLPVGARELMQRIANQEWVGTLIAIDYGKSWPALCEEWPEGTGRAYSNHRQISDLLANAGEQDLTCHICWDWLIAELEAAGFDDVRLESQESFFMRNASGVIREIVSGPAGPLDARHSQLKSLLHPGIMGQKFQVLSANRLDSRSTPGKV